MISKAITVAKNFAKDKDNLTLWMNNLLVLYAFLLPISQTIKSTVFTVMVILFILRGNVASKIKETLENKVVRAFLYLFIIYLVGLLWSDDLSSGLSAVKSIKYGLYIIIFYSIIDGRYIDKVVGAFILGMLVSEVVSYSMMLGIMPWRLELGGILFYATPDINSPSPFLNHIHYGVALCLAIILIAQKIFYSNNSIVIKILMSIFVLTATANIFLTGGRTGYITFILLTLVLSIFYLKRWSIIAIVFAFMVLITAYNFSPTFHARVIQTENSINKVFNKDAEFDTSIGVRAGLYYFSIDSIKNNPIFGVGTGDDMKAIIENTPEKWTAIHGAAHPHNQYLSTLISLGIVGLLIFLNIFYQVLKYKQEAKDLRFIMIFSTLAIAFGILTTQFNLRFFMPLWVVMLSVTMISRDRRTITNKLENHRVLKKILIIGIIFSVMSLGNQLLR